MQARAPSLTAGDSAEFAYLKKIIFATMANKHRAATEGAGVQPRPTPEAMGRAPRKDDHGAGILDQSVPFGAVGALALPAAADRAAGLTDISFARFRHRPTTSLGIRRQPEPFILPSRERRRFDGILDAQSE